MSTTSDTAQSDTAQQQGEPIPDPNTEPTKELACPECLDKGVTLEFQTPQGLASHRRREHGVELHLCPECQADGRYTAFERVQSLAAHRSRSHGVAGVSSASKQKKNTKKQKNVAANPAAAGDKRRNGTAVRNQRRSSAVIVPDNLSEREFAAFRLGVLRTLMSAIESGEIPSPAPILMQTFTNEAEYREQQLA